MSDHIHLTSLEEFDRQRSEVEELRRANLRLQRALTRATAKTDDLVEAVFSAAKAAALTMGPAPPVSAPPRDRRKGGHEVALVHATDWQLGKSTESYSIEVCRERILRFADKIRKITEVQRADHPVDSCHIMLGGDMVEGVQIFPGQPYEVESHLFEQMFSAVQLIEDFIRKMLTTFHHVEVHEEYGNHGRLGRRGDFPASDNVDRMLYAIVAERFKKDRRVTWHPSISWYQIVEIGNYRALLVHGDEIRMFGGNVPAYGIVRKFNAWASGVVEPFVDGYAGHFHQVMQLSLANGGRVFITGSPESGSEYAREFVAARGRPSQRLHYIDGEKGSVTSEHVIWLD